MRHSAWLLLAVVFCSAPLLTGTCQAAEKKKAAAAETGEGIMGKITTTKTDVDAFTSIKLTTPKGEVYNITLDEKGKGVAKQYEGISVYLSGTVTEKDKEKWLTVTSIGEKKKKKK